MARGMSRHEEGKNDERKAWGCLIHVHDGQERMGGALR